MAKSKFKVRYDSPVTLTVTILTVLLFIIDSALLKGKMSEAVFTSYGTLSDKAFASSNALSYIRILLHVFGTTSWSALLINSAFFLLIGTVLEDRYGSVIFALMIFISALVSGVIGIFSPLDMCGATPVIFMMIFLSAVTMISKRNLQISWVLIMVLYTAYSMATAFEKNGALIEGNGFIRFFQSNISTFICMAAGVASSLFGFLSSPKKRKASTKKSDDKSSINEDEEIIGTIEL